MTHTMTQQFKILANQSNVQERHSLNAASPHNLVKPSEPQKFKIESAPAHPHPRHLPPTPLLHHLLAAKSIFQKPNTLQILLATPPNSFFAVFALQHELTTTSHVLRKNYNNKKEKLPPKTPKDGKI